EISPVPCAGGGLPDSYSPRTAFQRQVVSDFIREPSLCSGTAEISKTFREVRESANGFPARRGEGGGSDSSPPDDRPRTASAHRPSCLKKRRTAPGQCVPGSRTRECCEPSHSLPTMVAGRGPWRRGS